MHTFTALLKRFDNNGEKTRWTYIDIPDEVTEALKPGQKTSFRVKGTLDEYVIERVALIPMGPVENRTDGSETRFIMGINAVMRKALRKEKGATVQVRIELDDSPIVLSANLMGCLEDDPAALAFFNSLTKGHQHYFSKWIEEAKTIETKTKRITQAVTGLSMGMGYPEMIRYFKSRTID
ncbi:DUF1905 domain-containing protein [Fibrisoma montanum]|uniref:DUF1905 domain-containing protein n=1 Tax=Fibrisoma montanum TaxID=2305895 RepID=A0A418LYQ7_9BACT|nr:YdeI/OmpD-associated family protein [Fibrisoma montanum]RIV18494.1 DUF1905 domain-containing protein [Fibrisoma montanum]